MMQRYTREFTGYNRTGSRCYDMLATVDGNYVKHKDAKMVESALIKASEAYAEFTGSCPYDRHDINMDCVNCDDNAAKCWQEYFLEEVGE